MSHDQRDPKVSYLRNVNRLMKNIIFNKTESFVGRNTSDHACQIFCSKGNCETMYHWFFLLEITVAKIMNNLNVCSAHSYLYPRFQFNWGILEIKIQNNFLENLWKNEFARVHASDNHQTSIRQNINQMQLCYNSDNMILL
jgi:hypothetical protein